MIKYLCIGGYFTPVKNKWIHACDLPALYEVPEDECNLTSHSHVQEYIPLGLIPLTFRRNGDYKTHLKVLKTHHLVENKL